MNTLCNIQIFCQQFCVVKSKNSYTARCNAGPAETERVALSSGAKLPFQKKHLGVPPPHIPKRLPRLRDLNHGSINPSIHGLKGPLSGPAPSRPQCPGWRLSPAPRAGGTGPRRPPAAPPPAGQAAAAVRGGGVGAVRGRGVSAAGADPRHCLTCPSHALSTYPPLAPHRDGGVPHFTPLL